MNDDDLSDYQRDQQSRASRLWTKLIIALFILGVLYALSYGLLYKWIGHKDTWREYYIENGEFVYCEELTLTDFTWGANIHIVDLLSMIYYPAMELDGTRVEPDEQEKNRVVRLFNKYLKDQAAADTLYFVYIDSDFISATEHGLLMAGEELFADLDEADIIRADSAPTLSPP